VKRIAVAWVTLIALMLASLGSAYLRLGAWNLAIGLAIAAAKGAVVLWLFMGLGRGPAVIRLAAAVAAFVLVLLVGLGGVDFATRVDDPASLQVPQQLRPLSQGGAAR
jgi:cytochrome c oxidase subunit 4